MRHRFLPSVFRVVSPGVRLFLSFPDAFTARESPGFRDPLRSNTWILFEVLGSFCFSLRVIHINGGMLWPPATRHLDGIVFLSIVLTFGHCRAYVNTHSTEEEKTHCRTACVLLR